MSKNLGIRKHDKESRPLAEWLSVKLDIPSDILCGGIRVEIRGRNSLTVHGCRKILTYCPCKIQLKMRDCVLSVTGERLICSSYLAGAVGIDGRIDSVEFLSREML